MSEQVLIALIAAGGAVVVAVVGLVGVWIQVGRARRGGEKDHRQVMVELAALQQSQDDTNASVKEIAAEQHAQGERLARIEGQQEITLLDRLRRQ